MKTFILNLASFALCFSSNKTPLPSPHPQLKEYCDTSNYEADIFPHQLRVGFSPKVSSLQLGEAENSYAWETTGQLVANNKYTLFGKPANVEDTVGVLVVSSEFIFVSMSVLFISKVLFIYTLIVPNIS